MKLIIPTVTDDTIFVDSNVTETISDIWDAGTTYNMASLVYLATGTQRDVYESLQALNTGNAPATETSWWAFRSTTYAEYDAGTTYDAGDIIVDAANHLTYESLQAANTGNALATSPLWWLLRGATNPWTAFDEKVGSQTERTGSITYHLAPGLIEGIAFFNVDAATIQIQYYDDVVAETRITEDDETRITEDDEIRVTESSLGEMVFSETIALINTDNVFDGYSYCFAPILTSKNAVITNLPPFSGSSTLLITIEAGGDDDTAKCGEIVFGRMRELGATQYGAGIEFIDYSRKAVDAFGNFSVVERAFSKRIPMDVVISTKLLGYLKQTLEDYRATPLVCVPTEAEDLAGPFLVYGYYRTARVVVRYPKYAILNIEWEGLT